MITVVIIDDEPKGVFALKTFLHEHCKEVLLKGTANNAQSGKELIEAEKPQLVFLDIEMPLGSGFDMLNALAEINFEIIFITAYDEYAINAFRFSALDYLLKPVRISQLMEAVDKAVKRIKEKSTSRNYDLLLENIREQTAGSQKIMFTDRGQQFPVAVNDIMYIIAEGNYSKVHTKDKVFLSSKKLKEFAEMLPEDVFCRVHHGHMVNVQYVAKIQKGRGGMLTMKDGRELEIAVRRKDEFVQRYKL